MSYWDGENLLLVRSADETVALATDYPGGWGALTSVSDQDPTSTFLLYDVMGNTRARTDASGAVWWRGWCTMPSGRN